MYPTTKRLARWRRVLAAGLLGTAMIWTPSNCDLGTFTATSTVTLDGREVVSSLVRSGILGPIETWIDNGIDYVFDKFEGNDA